MVYINTPMIERVRPELSWSERLATEHLRGLTPLTHYHISIRSKCSP